MNPKNEGGDEPEWKKKQREFEQVKARAKALKLRTTCSICSATAKLPCPCGTAQYCTTDCQRIDWRDRGHRKACKKIRDERAAEAARAEAPTPPPSPPREVFYGPAPRSHADEVRARLAAEHEAARLRREANPKQAPMSARFGSCCPICLEEWDVNTSPSLFLCCCRVICPSCAPKFEDVPCPLCEVPSTRGNAEPLALLRRHVENDIPEAVATLGDWYRDGLFGLTRSPKKAAKIYKRAVELGDASAMLELGWLYATGDGVKADKRKANQLYKMAAKKGSAVAQFNVGNNEAREGNWAAALPYYNSAASQGYIDAFAALGYCFEHGYGADPDLDEAKRWYARAAAKGNEPASLALARLGH